MNNNRIRLGRQFWQTQYDQWQDSNLSKAAFCRQASLNITSFYCWSKKFAVSEVAPVARKRPPAFIPMSLAQEPTPAFSLKVADVTLS